MQIYFCVPHMRVAWLVKNRPALQETWVQSLGWEDFLEKGTATHSSILAWRMPWTRIFMGLQRVEHDWVTFTCLPHMNHNNFVWNMCKSLAVPNCKLKSACFTQCQGDWQAIGLSTSLPLGYPVHNLSVLLPHENKWSSCCLSRDLVLK